MKKRTDPPPIGDRLLTLREAVEVLCLSTRAVREYVQRGEIEGRVIGGRWRFRRADLDAFFASAPVTGTSLERPRIVTQVALSLVLLLGAGPLVGTFQRLRSLNLGFDKDNLLEIVLNPKPGGDQNVNMNSYEEQLIEGISNLSGVRAVGLADISIPGPVGTQEQQKVSATSEDPITGFHVIANEVTIWPGFFNTLGIRLLSGSDFQPMDDEKHPRLAMVSKSLAERLFPNSDALGRHVRWSFWPDFQNLEIEGVAEDARIFDLREAAPPVIYLCYLQALPSAEWVVFTYARKKTPRR